MTTTIHTATVRVAGGREGTALSTDGALSIVLGKPAGDPVAEVGINPEHLFAAAFGSCFGSAIEAIARRDNVLIGPVTINATVPLIRDQGMDYRLGVLLDVGLTAGSDHDDIVRIIRDADMICPYSRAIAGNVNVAISVNGVALDAAHAPVPN